jgi:hypothetical protein
MVWKKQMLHRSTLHGMLHENIVLRQFSLLFADGRVIRVFSNDNTHKNGPLKQKDY